MACLNCGADRHTIMSTCALNASPHSVNESYGRGPDLTQAEVNEYLRPHFEAMKARRLEPLHRRIVRELGMAIENNNRLFGESKENFDRACIDIRVSREQALEAIAKVQQEESA